MKPSIALNAVCFVLFTTTAVLALQGKWMLIAILLLFGALCEVAAGILNYHYHKNYKTPKITGC